MCTKLVIGVAAIAALAGQASAVIHTLTDRNSVVNIDDASQSGMSDWIVDGTDHLFQQWFWFRVGNAPEASIDTLALTGTLITDTNGFDDPGLDTLSLRYTSPGSFEIQPTFTLRGTPAGSGRSDIAESIVITNLGTVPLTMSFFQYSDFDLNGSSGGDTLEIPGLLFNTAQQSEGATTFSETVVSPQPTRYEAALFPSIVSRLNDGVADDLGNIGGPISGDTTWGFQWDFTIPVGQGVTISKDKTITPAPGALVLLGMGGLLVSRRRR